MRYYIERRRGVAAYQQIVEQTERAVRAGTLRPGDRLIAVSDGVTEARNKDGAFYPLAERLPQFAAEEPAALTDAVWRDVSRFAGSVRDDLTLLVFAPLVRSDDATRTPGVPRGT